MTVFTTTNQPKTHGRTANAHFHGVNKEFRQITNNIEPTKPPPFT